MSWPSADVRVPHLVHDPPVRDDPGRVVGEREQDDRRVPVGGGEVRRIAVDLALEAEAVAVEGDGAAQVGDEEDGRDAGERRHAVRTRARRAA
jgi:hypothetical protein